MEQECACCPVCTLYMREGISLQSHLETHPKDKVIEALLRARNVNSTQSTPQPAEEHLHGQSGVAQNSGTVFQSKSHGSSQTQVKATVSYQHFVTTNASTAIPQYVHVVSPNSSPPVVPHHAFALMPQLQPPPYVQTMYNPLYNPYIPQPYPMVHPIYTNMPFSSDVNPLMSTSQITSPVIAPSPTQFTPPAIAPSPSQLTSPVIPPSPTQYRSPVIPPSPTQFTSPVITPPNSQVTNPVVAPPTQYTSPIITSSTSQVTNPVVAPSISPVPSTVATPSPTQFKYPVIPPSPTQFTSPVIPSSNSQVTNPVVAPSISPVPSTVATPSPTQFKYPAIPPSPTQFTSTVIPSSTNQFTSPVIASPNSQVTNPVVAPSPTQYTPPGTASSNSQVTNSVIPPSPTQFTAPIIPPSPTQFTSPVIPSSNSQVTNSAIPPSHTQFTAPIIPPSPTQFTSPVIPSSNSQVTNSVIPPSPTQFTAPIIPPSPTQFTSPVIPSSTNQFTSPVIPSSTSQVTNSVIPPSPTQFTAPIIPPSPTQFTSPVIPSSNSQVTNSVIPPSPTQYTSPVIPSSTSQVTNSVIPPSPTAFTAPVIPPSPTQFTSPVIPSSTSQVTNSVIPPSPTQFTSPIIPSSNSQVTNSVISPSPTQFTSPVITPPNSQVTNPVVAPSPTQYTSPIIPSSNSQLTNSVIPPSPTQFTSPVIPSSNSQLTNSVIPPSPTQFTSPVIPSSNSQVTNPVVAPSPTQYTSPIIPSSNSQVTNSVISPSPTAFTAPVIPPSPTQFTSPVIPSSTNQYTSPIIPSSNSQVTNSVVSPSPSAFTAPVIPSSPTQFTSPVIPSSNSQVTNSVIPPSSTQFTSPVIPSSNSQVTNPVVTPSISPVPSMVVAPSTSQDVSGGMLDPVLKEVSSIATNTSADPRLVGRRKSKKLKLSLKLNSKRNSRLHSRLNSRLLSRLNLRLRSRLNSRSQRVFKSKKQVGLRRELTASATTESLSQILTSRSPRTDANGTTNAVTNTSVIATTSSSKFESKPISPPKTSHSPSPSVITQISMPMEFMFRSRSPSEASHSPMCSPGPTPPPSVPLPTPETIESDDVHLDPEDSNIKTEFKQKSEHTANMNEYSVSCERAASSCSVITDRNSAVVFAGDMYVSNCNMYENISDCESPNEPSFLQLPFDEEANPQACDQQSEMSDNVSENFKRNIFGGNQGRLSEYNGEIPENVFQPYRMEQEEKASFNFDFGNREADQRESNADREKISCESDEFAPEESLLSGARDEEPEDSDLEFADHTTRGSAEGENITPGVKKLSSVIFLRNSSGSNSATPMSERTPQIEEEMDFCDRKSVTYTDLQPATDNSVLGGFGMASCSNLNNYMEVDGVKIFFTSGNEENRPLEPVVKYSTPKIDEPKVQDCVKPENERETLAESVIHLASGTTPKGDFSGETFNASTSENNSEVRDLSPLSLNIRADESMPARGELSEQESLGAENTTWNLFRAEIITKSERDLMSGNEFRSTILDIEDCGGEGKSVKSSFWREGKSVKGSFWREGKSVKGSFWREGIPILKKENTNDSAEEDDKSKKGTLRKPKIFYCPQCQEKFRSLRNKKKHLLEIHSYNFKNGYEPSPPNGTQHEREIFPKNDVTETKSETDNVSAIAEQFIKDNLAKIKSAVNKPVERLPSCEIVRLCPDCRVPCMGLKKLREHLKEVHGTSKFKCEDCCEMFEGEKEYNNHLQVHPLKCKECGKSFTRKQSLKLHVKRHLTVKPHACNQCSKTFITRQKLDEHLNGHAGIKPLKCLICDRTFSRHSNLIQHKNLHHNRPTKKVKDFICRCGEVFHSASKLAWHKEVHDPKPKDCPFCAQKFIHKNSVTRHIRRAHVPDYLPYDKKDTDNIQCPICGKMYVRSSLLVHMRIHSGERPYACRVCTKRFTTKWNMEIHSWTHQSRNNLPFRCITCKSAFFREPDYIAHMNAHRNMKPFTCNVCGQRFIRKYNCLRHEEEHKAEKKFSCTVAGCDKSFHRNYYLKDHLRIHSGVRPHTCHICGKASSTKSNHNKHIRIHDTREFSNTES